MEKGLKIISIAWYFKGSEESHIVTDKAIWLYVHLERINEADSTFAISKYYRDTIESLREI
ncbi:hypothetical protein [Chryseobacterium sp. MA9]|uniref:hypothetical protein n=1 Tax=Chryseobacterium sp. MA9 TaxID=2966625 RepID=UPI002101F5B2|nr:hypothetical protein [Chryseobacterium sp. MA9]UTX50090.1 hypothetical protein KIK00_07505 [Chryseobacterium sp. MA9]